MKRNTGISARILKFVTVCIHTKTVTYRLHVDILYRGVGSDFQVHRTYFLLQEIVYITYRIIQIIQFNFDTV